MNILAIDQGTSGTKAVVWSPEGGVLAAAEVPVRPRYLEGGLVEQDPEQLLGSVLEAGSAAVASADVPVDAVALANQGETVLAWDRETGDPLSVALVWQDRRAQSICAGLAAEADRLLQDTGLTLDSYFSAPKMAWLRRAGVEGGVVTTSDSWLVHRLTGEFVTDRSTASRSMLVRLGEEQWADDLVSMFGLADEDLPAIVACDAVVGSTDAFGSDVPVAGLVVDQPAALFAQDCLMPGDTKCTFGTGAFLLANTGEEPVRSRAGLTSSVAWRARGVTTNCLDGQIYTAASAVRWLQDIGLVSAPEQIDAEADLDTDGVVCVPALAGLGGPWWRPEATASLRGLQLSTTKGQIIGAVLSGIAAQVAELCASVAHDLGGPLTRLRVDGGLTRSAALMQAQADIAQIPVEVFPSTHATALGAAGFARLALDPSLAVGDALPGATPTATYEPRWSADRAAAYLETWRAAVEADRALGADR